MSFRYSIGSDRWSDIFFFSFGCFGNGVFFHVPVENIFVHLYFRLDFFWCFWIANGHHINVFSRDFNFHNFFLTFDFLLQFYRFFCRITSFSKNCEFINWRLLTQFIFWDNWKSRLGWFWALLHCEELRYTKFIIYLLLNMIHINL